LSGGYGTVADVQDRPDLLTHGCARCPARWFGLERAHCTACATHQTFDDVALYDTHRLDGRCAPPSSVGLAKNKGGIWVR
jgi:hypothetical protein